LREIFVAVQMHPRFCECGENMTGFIVLLEFLQRRKQIEYYIRIISA